MPGELAFLTWSFSMSLRQTSISSTQQGTVAPTASPSFSMPPGTVLPPLSSITSPDPAPLYMEATRPPLRVADMRLDGLPVDSASYVASAAWGQLGNENPEMRDNRAPGFHFHGRTLPSSHGAAAEVLRQLVLGEPKKLAAAPDDDDGDDDDDGGESHRRKKVPRREPEPETETEPPTLAPGQWVDDVGRSGGAFTDEMREREEARGEADRNLVKVKVEPDDGDS
ncbi:hypothetical protein B0T24DRAFT_596544 [Lasiosphaeria ovina]|uniref:Uncharacterized protein n=1 Tax=Lasiosphaeria ovina TaxID=92902 RepID=A0AAE0N246_9PEZI|nr:hypothetical protein B0T24DRAFT_596544 [Lasiosphaeria ovina]